MDEYCIALGPFDEDGGSTEADRLLRGIAAESVVGSRSIFSNSSKTFLQSKCVNAFLESVDQPILLPTSGCGIKT